MKWTNGIAAAIALGVLGTSAQAQFTLLGPPKAKSPGVTLVSSSGGYLGGADDCSSTHPLLGPGDVVGEPFATGTTGTTGQNEANCLFFGTTGIANDVWYNWRANANGTATLATCGQTGVDTKVAIWPQTTCPPNGASLACNDDACGQQTSVSWFITNGAVYTIQLGTFPGAGGGSGTFDVTQGPWPCGVKDDGSTESALGLTNGGELGWIKTMDCITEHDTVSSAYGTAMFPGSVTNGSSSQIVVYENPAGSLDPNDPNWVPLTKIATVVVNGDTDILNPYTYPKRAIPPGSSTMVLASAQHAGSSDPNGQEFPGPTDFTGSSNPNAWVVGASGKGATLNTTTLSANSTPPLRLTDTGIAATWLLRIEDTDGGRPGTPVCFGDGSGAPCGCGNESLPDPGSGCLNSVSPGSVGPILGASGDASVSRPNLTLLVSGVLTAPGLFFQALNTIAGGAGLTFGDGIRCCGGSVIRLSLEDPPTWPEPTTTSTTLTATDGGITPGDKRCYQYWYRDPGGPCASGFNLSNAVTVTWVP